MRFAIGYQQPEDGPRFPEIVAPFAKSVREVYFPWVGSSSGRAPLGRCGDSFNWNAQRILEEDLLELRSLGFKLDLLFNASCYGGAAASQALDSEVTAIVEHLGEFCGVPEIVTTASPAIAWIIKRRFPEIDVRASVNMKLGTIQAMGYVAELFDSFHLQRDFQRDLPYVKRVADWCHARGKKLCLLANSGCLRFCPGQSFHDNLVAHESEASKTVPLKGFSPILCRHVVGKDGGIAELLKATWIRPEDISKYEGVVDVVKLATRQHSHLAMVAAAYSSKHFEGNLLDLLEPGFSQALSPLWIDNQAFPKDWSERIGECIGDCAFCGYCDGILQKVLKRMDAA